MATLLLSNVASSVEVCVVLEAVDEVVQETREDYGGADDAKLKIVGGTVEATSM